MATLQQIGAALAPAWAATKPRVCVLLCPLSRSRAAL